ncbi:MAG: sigma-70 family RNA polymerase sigma factor [Hymenobacteraceae bacterium]|nr:sigma-70 family RNA polymerase sigma factor [Hymenobacteraceae bacterium]
MPVSPLSSADAALADLLARCRRHEPAAQQALYERFAGPMFLLAQRYAPTLADAEDALQDAFVTIFSHLHEQAVAGAFAGWVRRIVIRTALNAGRSRRVRRVEFELDDAHHVPTPDASVIEQLTFGEVQALIDRLPEGCRLVLLLYTIEGYSHAEIAALLGVGESASKAQLTRARQRLTLLVQQASRERAVHPPAPAGQPTARADASASLSPHFHPITALLFQ